MTQITLQNPNPGIIRKAPVGFSFTNLFFGPVPALTGSHVIPQGTPIENLNKRSVLSSQPRHETPQK